MMKLKLLLGMLVVALCAVSFVSCLDEDENKDKVEIVTMTVAPEVLEKVTTLFLSDFKWLAEFLKVKEGNNGEWREMDFGTLSGFHFEDGTEYQLEVEKTYLNNPPEDGPSVSYRLIKVLSEVKVNKEIVKVERFYTGECVAVLEGEALTEKEKTEIEASIKAVMPWTPPYVVYKFVYTDVESPQGDVIIYSGENKKEGVFEREEKLPAYTLTVGEKQMTYTLSRSFARMSVEEPMAFITDVTAMYQIDYPNLTKALVQRPIFRIR